MEDTAEGRPAKHRLTARDCLSAAEGSANQKTRATFLNLAFYWASLADQAEKNEDLRLRMLETLGPRQALRSGED